MTPEIKAHIDAYLKGPYDEKSKQEVQDLLRSNPEALVDAFFTDLSFGTGGLRGLMGVGTNRMNVYTVAKATQGLASYIKKNGNPKAGVVIGYDSRHHSKEFAEETARVLAGNGVRAFLLPEIRPTPFVSFATRAKKAQAGVMITASHNPKEYNGYKVYWSDGGQVVSPHDKGIMAEVEAVKVVLRSDDFEILDTSLDEAYLDAITKLRHFKEPSDLKIAYTSLHGVGITLMPEALKRWGFSNVVFVEKQITADGDFPTVKFPNPEYPETLSLGIDTMKKSGADILLATDPDADRLAIAAQHGGKPVILSGNEIAAICTYFLCETLPSINKGAFVTTIVTTELLKIIATAYHYACFEVLTGFKYIGEKIHEWEIGPEKYTFLFGAEESYGYLLGTHSRDKDGIVSGCFIAEIAHQLKKKGQTLVDYLHAIYKRFGLFREKQLSMDFSPGLAGTEEIKALMKRLRDTVPQNIAGQKVISCEDFLKPTPEKLPRSDVLLFRLADKSKIIIRPSGTEPKLKIYASVRQEKFDSIDQAIKECDAKLSSFFSTLKKELQG
ncbi:MAG: phospho-sugar mutase [Verrucomicrobia bacterium]|nr:phospho-sugar mutase [Verrucomicrobiota bacterium]